MLNTPGNMWRNPPAREGANMAGKDGWQEFPTRSAKQFGQHVRKAFWRRVWFFEPAQRRQNTMFHALLP
jgi:hypothetical protein